MNYLAPYLIVTSEPKAREPHFELGQHCSIVQYGTHTSILQYGKQKIFEIEILRGTNSTVGC